MKSPTRPAIYRNTLHFIGTILDAVLPLSNGLHIMQIIIYQWVIKTRQRNTGQSDHSF